MASKETSYQMSLEPNPELWLADTALPRLVTDTGSKNTLLLKPLGTLNRRLIDTIKWQA